ncbi:predicted protein [Thalassiosira pseudonana CCMP1335]|uniref:DNA repair protein RecN n=1 Tax=Thalassiosira pseudonana TaxID=35128 RepID=B8C1M4_THAPS|nr:predicted protein [Thalassiosira pseudonana CCMP1335]EED92241.1 predicted protein [Thalassiosira pseudonana CCMP1335]
MPHSLKTVFILQLSTVVSSFQCLRPSVTFGIDPDNTKIHHGFLDGVRPSTRTRVRAWSDISTGHDTKVRNSLLSDEGSVPSFDHSSNTCHRRSSQIVSIKSTNIAGLTNSQGTSDIEVNFGSNGACFIAVTGESGSGKSLLVSKAVDLVTGGKAVATLVPTLGEGGEDERSSVEMISSSLERFGIDPTILSNDQSTMTNQLHLQRTLQWSDTGRLKSICRINGKHISLKSLRHIAAPLFTRVDVGAAATALARPASRLAMIDMGVEDSLKQNCLEMRESYKRARKKRMRLKSELESRVLPSSMQGSGYTSTSEEDQTELLGHWVDELEKFETRTNLFRDALLGQYNELMMDQYNEHDNKKSSGLLNTLQNFKKTTWGGGNASEDNSLFATILEFREEIKAVESQLASAHAAYESLASLSSPESAAVALEKVRKLLYSISRDNSGPLFDSIETTHDLLNEVESSLNECARSIDGDSNSVISTLEQMICNGISIEEIDNIVADWNSLARKHGISPYALPKCHESLRQELDGNVEALLLLPEAEKEERVALKNFSLACKELSDARNVVATNLSEAVSQILPSLGLEGTSFQVQLKQRQGGFEDPYFGADNVGVDLVDFLLLHQKSNTGGQIDESQRGGNIEQVGSSGEKSRVLLAIETALPGSIGSTCNAYSNSADNVQTDSSPKAQPICIIYDEIDAHVGGRAAVTMAKLLADQTRKAPDLADIDTATMERGSQIIAITHSASVAAIADKHIVVERTIRQDSTASPVRALTVDGSSRRKEIARMASGDLAAGEAEAFADALIRDALLQRKAP